MIQGRDKVFEWLRLNQTPYWKLKDQRGQDLKGSSPNVEDLSMDTSLEHLSMTFDTVGEGYYTIEAWEKKGQTKEWKRDLIKVGDTVANPAIAGIGYPGPISQADVDEKVMRAMDDYKKQLRLEQLEARVRELEALNKELELELDGFDKRIYNRISPFVGALYKGLGIEPVEQAAVAGAEANVEDAEQRLEAAFEKWQKHEGDPVTMVEKIALLAETDNTTYQVARNILMSK